MKNLLMIIVAGGLTASLVATTANSQEEDMSSTAVPVEIFTCDYRDGKGPKDLDKVTANWNVWADNAGVNDYTAWTLVPFYASEEQDFDVLWLGVSPTARQMGSAQDKWLATGGKIQAEFDSIVPCDAHSNFASLEFKAPPQRDNPPNNVVISFSDCNIADGMSFGDVAPALDEWAAYRTEHGSTGGMWVLFPAYGGGGEEFDFKFLTGHRNLEEQGADWDQYAEAGWAKAEELFTGKLECDSARVYLAQNRRRASAPE